MPREGAVPVERIDNFPLYYYSSLVNRSARGGSRFELPEASLLHLIVIRCISVTTKYMQQGTIAGLNDKGFGFIKRDGEEKDLFFHMNELVNAKFEELQVGDAVTFNVGEGPKGPNATQVTKV